MYEKKMPSLKINALLNSISSIMAIIFPLITYPYATRVLQAENLGRVNFASSTISYFSLIAVLGITSYAAREAGIDRTTTWDYNKLSYRVYISSMRE